MATLFIFAKDIGEEQSLCLKLDSDGLVLSPLLRLPHHEIRILQDSAKTVVIIPSNRCSFHEVSLPWLPDRKARLAIPYALEEALAADLGQLHVAFDKAHYQQGRYLVAVIEKQYLLQCMATLDAFSLRFDEMTPDWFALSPGEAVLTSDYLLVSQESFKGALSGDLLALYLKREARTVKLLKCNDALPLRIKGAEKIAENSDVFIASRLLNSHRMNLCQGELQHDDQWLTTKQWYQVAGALALVFVGCFVLFQWVNLHQLNRRMLSVDQQIASIYHDFFPNSPRVISPKFRISERLKEGGRDRETSAFWWFISKLSQAFDEKQNTIEKMNFQYPTLSVTLSTPNFEALENLQLRLQKEGVSVTQAQASTNENKVLATIDLHLETSR